MLWVTIGVLLVLWVLRFLDGVSISARWTVVGHGAAIPLVGVWAHVPTLIWSLIVLITTHRLRMRDVSFNHGWRARVARRDSVNGVVVEHNSGFAELGCAESLLLLLLPLVSPDKVEYGQHQNEDTDHDASDDTNKAASA
jgi:hypothetical protein